MANMTSTELAQLMAARGPQAKPRAKRFEGPVSIKKRKSLIEQRFLAAWDGPEFTTEHRFHSVRKWRFDYAWPEAFVAMEIDGAIFGGASGHNTGIGIARDAEKSNAAVELGWRLIRLTAKSDLADEIRRLKLLLTAKDER
jgi:very-short-patch-repair endonuclease